MTPKQRNEFNSMRNALKLIAEGYQTPAQLRRNSEAEYGLEYCEALEMAYDNIRQAARTAVKGVRELKG